MSAKERLVYAIIKFLASEAESQTDDEKREGIEGKHDERYLLTVKHIVWLYVITVETLSYLYERATVAVCRIVD